MQNYETSVKELWARVDNPSRLGTMWVEIKAPDYQTINFEKSGQAEMDLKKEVFHSIAMNEHSKQYERHVWNNLTGFTTPGTYQVFYFAIDDDTKHASSLMETLVYKAKIGNHSPDPFQLISPENIIIDTESTTGTTMILRWQHASDPDDDFVTYTVLLSEKNRYFFNPIQKNSLLNNSCLFNLSHGIKNFTRYYWKVIAIDKYGAKQESDIWTFYTDDKINAIDGSLEAYVYNELNGQLVNDAIVIVGNLANAKKTSKGYFLNSISSGEYNITIKAPGYLTKTFPDIEIPRMDTLITNFRIVPEGKKGDLNVDGVINIRDVIFGLKVLAYMDDATVYVNVDMGIVLYVFQEIMK